MAQDAREGEGEVCKMATAIATLHVHPLRAQAGILGHEIKANLPPESTNV